MKSGIPVAGIVSADDLQRLDQLDRLEQERAECLRVIDEMRAAFHDVQAEQIEQKAARSLAAVRGERKQASPPR